MTDQPKPKALHRGTERRSLQEIETDLHRPVPEKMLKTHPHDGYTYIEWHAAQKLFTRYTNGFWHYKVLETGTYMMPAWEKKQVVDRLHVIVKVAVIVEHAEGTAERHGLGMEALPVKGFGDALHNAEAQAVKRAFARFGLCLNLYEK